MKVPNQWLQTEKSYKFSGTNLWFHFLFSPFEFKHAYCGGCSLKMEIAWMCFEAYLGAYPCQYGIKLFCSLVMNLASVSQSGETESRTCCCESKSNPPHVISNGHCLQKLQKISRHKEPWKSNLASTSNRTSCKSINSCLYNVFLLISPTCHPFINLQQTCLVLCLNYYVVRSNQT